MVHVHVQPHADGVGGHQKVHLARLEQLDLGVAGAGAQAAHDHGGPAPLATQQFGDGVDLLGREGDDGAAAGQAGQLLGPGVGQGGQALAGDDLRLGDQGADQRGHGPGPQEHGLEPTARVQQALGEDVTALRVGDQLDFVHGQELDLTLQRHGFDGADEIGRARRDDLFLAGDQGDGGGPSLLDDPLIDLARQQAQRQADHARGVTQHPLDRQMGLAGVGGAQDRCDARHPLRNMGQTCGTITHVGFKVEKGRAFLKRNRAAGQENEQKLSSAWNGRETNHDRISDIARFNLCSLQDIVS